MTTQDQFSDLITSVTQQEQIILQNRQHRNLKYKKCLQQYTNHLKKQIIQFQQSNQSNQLRNKLISNTFENTYDKLCASLEIGLRKTKHIILAKQQFSSKILKMNLQLLQQYYQQNKDVKQLYEQLFNSFNSKKTPYKVIFNKKNKDQSLKVWQARNRKFEDQVHKGTDTLHQWKKAINGQKKQDIEIIGFIGKPSKSNYQIYPSSSVGEQFLKNFQRKKF